jgi:hypothetical protein
MSEVLMNSSSAEGSAIRIASAGHVFLAATMIWLGVMGLSTGTFVQVWQPVPKWVPAREPLAYLCAFISWHPVSACSFSHRGRRCPRDLRVAHGLAAGSGGFIRRRALARCGQR